jgi:hypothetical protein
MHGTCRTGSVDDWFDKSVHSGASIELMFAFLA